MSNTLNVTPPRIDRQVNRPRGGKEESQELGHVAITKTGGGLVGYHLKVRPANPEESWIRVCPDGLALDPIHPDCALVSLELTVPPDATYGLHCFDVECTADDNNLEPNPVKVVIDVQDPLKNWLQEKIWHIIALGVIAIVVVAIVAAIVVRNSPPAPSPRAQTPTSSAITPALTNSASSFVASAEPIAATIHAP